MRKSRLVKIAAGFFALVVGGVVYRAFDATRHAGPAKSEAAAADWATAAAPDIVDVDLFDKARAIYTGMMEIFGAGQAALPGIEVLALSIAGMFVVLYLLTRLSFIRRLFWKVEHEAEKEIHDHPGEYMSMSMDFLRVTTIVVGFAVALLVVHALMDLGKVLM
jgi:hypothetical protein